MLTRVFVGVALAVGLTAMAGEVNAMRCEDIPREAPHDGVMASGAEVSAVARWALTVFGGLTTPMPGPPVPLDVVRQDFSSLHFGRSCLDTPLRIGTQDFPHGLGTHANSEIHARVPEGAVRFEAFAGIDHAGHPGQRGLLGRSGRCGAGADARVARRRRATPGRG